MDGSPAICTAISTTRQLLQSMFYSIAQALIMDKAKGQKIQYVPGLLPPGGLVMDDCLELMPTPV